MSARRWYSLLALAAVVGACAKKAEETAAAPPAVDSAAVRTAIADAWQRWIAADTAGNVAALAAMWGDSARADIRGMPPIMGRAAAQAAFETMLKEGKINAESVTPDMTIPIANDLVYQNGNYTETVTTKGKTATEYGRYALALHKDTDGQWRWAYVMAFADSTVPKK
jgi:ketosteroid isomerase-like protein